MKTKILIVENDELLLEHIACAACDCNLEPLKAESPDQAIQIFAQKQGAIRLLVCDWNFEESAPDWQGIDLIRKLKEQTNNEIYALMITARTREEDYLQATKAGADYFVHKPVKQPDLVAHLRQAARIAVAEAELRSRIIANSKVMRDLYIKAREIAQFDDHVLITGDTGTGKEALAKFIHDSSRRAKEPFLTVNAAGIPEALADSELFGFMKGAHSTAFEYRMGHFEAVSEGTLFLDEVTELSLPVQSKLLRVLETKDVLPAGASKSIPVNTRVIAAANVDVEKRITERRFREDLYERFGAAKLQVPPLRDRKEDIVPIARFYLAHQATMMPHRVEFTLCAENWLTQQDWPRNVRELKNWVIACTRGIKKYTINADDMIAFRQQQSSAAAPNATVSLPSIESLRAQFANDEEFDLQGEYDAYERACFLAALVATKGNQSKAQRLLKLPTGPWRTRLENDDVFRQAVKELK